MSQTRTVQALLFRALHEAYPACGPGCALDLGAVGETPLPVERWLTLLDHLAAAHHPELARPEALRAIGRASLDGQLRGLAGPAIGAMLELGPERYLLRSVALSGRLLSFGRWEVSLLGAGRLRVTCEDNPIPVDYYLGVCARGFELCGASLDVAEVAAGPESFSVILQYAPRSRARGAAAEP